MLKNKSWFLPGLFLALPFTAIQAQDNSPYSRYGLGNQTPRMNVMSRGMGGVSAAFSDINSVNYNNPASYGAFFAKMEERSKKVEYGRVVLDAGINFSNRKLAAPNTPQSFSSGDALFSHVFVGIPIRRNWGLSFGLRPMSRISYNILRQERLREPGTNEPIDSTFTQFTGTGGTFLPTIGTGFGTDNFRVGVNVGYLFGKKELTTRRGFLNDSVQYAASNHTTNANFGNVFIMGGLQYDIHLTGKYTLRLGASGNLKHTLTGTQDVLRQTYVRNSFGQELQVDSVSEQKDIPGEVIYPASYTAGFILDNAAGEKTRGWAFGVDYVGSKWEDFRFFGAKDQVHNSWEVRMGAQLTPMLSAARYGQFITYRFGLVAGKDYINVDNNLPVYGVSFGLGLPLPNYSRVSSQFSSLNLAFEYNKRGNDQNKIKEDLFRISLGLNFTDLWFGKRKYD